MSGGLFQNGNRRVARLMILELACGLIIVALGIIQGMLPSQDWIPAIVIKIVSFAFGVTIALLKSAEMFFSKTAGLLKSGQISMDTQFFQNPLTPKPAETTVLPVTTVPKV